ncbi:MAG: methionine--tRNA ligase [Chloroflexi bacterium]|nr:methionine--tRNA ligase [Chloroflexota bacterium]
MGEKILVAVAWPYSSSYVHVGNVGGVYLPADIFARYQRLRGNDVLMVSGSDSHGTPVTVKADEEGVSPREVFERYHQSFLDDFIKLGLTYDLFTHTDTENHHRVAQDIFLTLLRKGYLFTKTMQQLYCENCHKFLPDRYVYGTCPHCGSEDARGDQCEACGRPLDAIEIVDPVCRLCGHRPVVRETEHFFLDLPVLNERLLKWVEDKTYWRPNVYNFTINYLKEGLQGRPITRDMEWGIPVPVEGYEDKCIYVWFEAVIGYFSASVEWARITGEPEKWKEWWYKPGRSYYFIAKDNIPFHSIIWPAILMGTERLYAEEGQLNLPYDVPSNEFLNLEGRKISGSRNWAVWLPDYLERYDPDPLRYYLTANAPESRDTDFSWADFWRRNNDELVATWGNLANRVLSFAYKNFDKRVPAPGQLDESDQALLDKVEAAFEPVGQLLDGCKFKAALGEAMALAHEANRYLNEKAPWLRINEDRGAAGTTIYVALRVIDSLKTLFYPFLPFSSQALHRFLGYDGNIVGRQYVETLQEERGTHQALRYDGSGLEGEWAPSQLPAGQALRKPRPLFKKLDESIVEEELARLRGAKSNE